MLNKNYVTSQSCVIKPGIHVESGGGGWAFGASEKANSLRMPQSQRMPSNSGVAWGGGLRTVVAPLAEVHATPLPSNYA